MTSLIDGAQPKRRSRMVPPPGKRSPMVDGIRKYLGRDGRAVSYQVKVSARDAKTGNVRAVWKTFATEDEARAERDRLRVDRREGRLVFPASTTVGQWVTAYVAGKQGAATSRQRYEHLAAHVVAGIGGLNLQALSAPDVERFRDSLALAPRTKRATLVLLKAACAKAVVQGGLAGNPCVGVEMPDIPEGETQSVLAPEDVGNLLRLLAGPEYWLPVAILAYTGLRRGELCALRWRSIDLEAQTLHVGGTVQRTRKGLAIEAPKTNRSRRTLAIDPGLAAELRRHKAAQAEEGLNRRLEVVPLADAEALVWAHPRNPKGLESFT